MKQAIHTAEAPSAPGLLSQAIVSNGFIFVAGQVHILPDNSLVGETTEQKMNLIMKNISTILMAANSSLEQIVKVTIYVTDMSIMPDFNKLYPTFFSEPLPAREAICVAALPLGASIEISVIAAQN